MAYNPPKPEKYKTYASTPQRDFSGDEFEEYNREDIDGSSYKSYRIYPQKRGSSTVLVFKTLTVKEPYTPLEVKDEETPTSE